MCTASLGPVLRSPAKLCRSIYDMFSCLSYSTRFEPSPCALCALRRNEPRASSARASTKIPYLGHASHSRAPSIARHLGTIRADVFSKVGQVHRDHACKHAALFDVAAAFTASPLPFFSHMPEASVAVRRRQPLQLVPLRPQLSTLPKPSSYRCSSRGLSSPCASVSIVPSYASGEPTRPQGNGKLTSVCGGTRIGAVY